MRYTETNVPTTSKVIIKHFHTGNSSRSSRKGHHYMTLCQIYDRESHTLLGKGEAYCSRKDLPSRSTGRSVAIGRAMKAAGFMYVPL